MVKIGDKGTLPESGWSRYDNTDERILYEGSWNIFTTSSYDVYGDSYTQSPQVDDKIKFNFIGTGVAIRTYSNNDTTYIVKIDDSIIGEYRTLINATTGVVGNGSALSAISFVVTGLKNKEHRFELVTTNSGTINFDCVDIQNSGGFLSYGEFPKLILKNPTTNQHYSLAEKTLISLPDSSSKNMILYGIETGKVIKLDEDFDKVNYPVEGVLRETVKTMVKPLSVKFE